MHTHFLLKVSLVPLLCGIYILRQIKGRLVCSSSCSDVDRKAGWRSESWCTGIPNTLHVALTKLCIAMRNLVR